MTGAETSDKQKRLVDFLRTLESCAVAMSGGVDSVVVAKAAQLALEENAVAVTGVGPSLAEGELETARDAAQRIGIRHETLETHESQNAAYRQNAPDRCYHCKTELYGQMTQHLDRWRVQWLANGANTDDLGDYRPGMKAAAEHRVVSPLVECGLGKGDIRAMALAWELPVWDKPAAPCLASRVAYGEEVTPERLERIDQAEQFLRANGLRDVRVRYHRDDLARLEIPADQIARFAEEPLRSEIVERLTAIGFRYITLDLQGLRSGSLNLVMLD